MGQFGKGREPINLLKSKVLYAMENSKSNAEAARFLRVSYLTYKKYAKLYKDEELGKTLFELHKNKAGKGSVSWDGTNSENKSIASGIYYYTIETKEAFNRKKMVLIK